MEAATESLVLSQVQRELDAETYYQNRKLAMSEGRLWVGELPRPKIVEHRKPMSITGSTHLAASIKDKINAAKARAQKATEGSEAALAKFNSAMDQAEAVNQSIEAEADDLVAQLGQFTNGGPT